MHVNCLFTQEGLFETRLLRQVIEPIFVDAERVEGTLDAPLMLYGQWHSQGFRAGMQWLASIAYKLPHPCIVLPPFESGSLNETLGLTTQLSMRAVNANKLSILHDAEPLKLGGRQTMQFKRISVLLAQLENIG